MRQEDQTTERSGETPHVITEARERARARARERTSERDIEEEREREKTYRQKRRRWQQADMVIIKILTTYNHKALILTTYNHKP